MTTLAKLKETIADDLHRTDLTNLISDEVSRAAKFYSRERLWFLEGSHTFTTSASQAWYSAPSDFQALDSALITISGSKTPLLVSSYGEIDEKDTGIETGDPSEIAFYANQFRLYPTANSSTSVVTLSYHKSLDLPTASGSNAWTSTAHDLIRHRVEKIIYRTRLRNPDMAALEEENEMREYSSLISETVKKISTGRLGKSGF